MVVKDEHRSFIYKLARIGCYAIGAVYLLIGVFAMLSFLKLGDDSADEERIVGELMEMPMGEVLVGAIILGMIAYIIWRIFEAITDPYDFGTSYKGLAQRTGIGLSSIGYAVIAYSAAQVLFGNSDGNGEEEQQSMVAQVFQWPGGVWLIGLLGVITAGAGIVQFKFVLDGSYKERVRRNEISDTQWKLIKVLAYLGYFARGIILLVLGYFVISAAVQIDPEEIGDTDTAFDFIGGGGTTLGDISFILVAVGTISYGFFMFLIGTYYKFENESEEEFNRRENK